MSSSPPRTSADEAIRVPPHNQDAERSLLGAILLDNRVLDETMSRLSVEDFYREQHRHVFRAMTELHVREEPIDVITLGDHLAADDRLEAVGGASYLARLSNAVPSAANVGQYAEIVRRKAALRKFIGTADGLVHDAYGDVSDVEAFMDDVERKLFAITQSGQKQDYAAMREVIKQAFTQIEALYDKNEHITGVPSGFADLDKITAGWQDADLVIVAARPAMGKTSFTLNMATHTCVDRDMSAAFFSLEMSNEQLAIRMLCSQARVDQSKLRRGNMSEQEWARLIKAAGALSEAELFLDDTPALPIMEFRSKCRRLKAEHDISIVFIDYLQLMKGSGGHGSREQEISEISRNLKAVAKELDIPVVALAQLNRGVESRADKRPMMSDLRECVVGQTPVALADGSQVPIQELVGRTPQVLAVDGGDRLVEAASDKIWAVGHRPVYEVELASGRSLTATAGHRVRCQGGWRRVDELAVGQRVGIAGMSADACAGRMVPQAASVANLTAPDAECLPDDGRVESAVRWEAVAAIEPAGGAKVYDLTVPGPACWLSDGIISHNSGAIEQDADIITFIYRDEVYNPDTEDKGIAEIIIGKHRNGSMGTVRLRFFGPITRFENLASDMDM